MRPEPRRVIRMAFFGFTPGQLTPLPCGEPGARATSVEVYDPFTGWTRVFVPLGPIQ